MLPTNPFRTIAFRLALLYGGVSTVSTAVLLALIYWGTTTSFTREIDANLAAEIDALLFETGHDLHTVVERIELRMQSPSPAADVYLLQLPPSRVLAGNVHYVRPILGPFEAEVQGADAGHFRVRATGILIAGGAYLLVGVNTVELERVQGLVRDSFVIAGAATLALSLSGGILLGRRFAHRIDVIQTNLQRIVDGALEVRLPVGQRRDELDRLTSGINEMLDRLQALMEGLRQVSNDIAHDLRTPLTRLRQLLEEARLQTQGSDGAPPQALARSIDMAIDESESILQTFSALLRIAQIEAGTRKAGFATLDLSDLVQTVVDVYRPVAEDRDQRLLVDITPGIVIRGDGELLTQMFANLIENALQHTPPGTLVSVGLARSKAGGRPATLVTVADTGPGIPPEDRFKVFRRLYRRDASRNTPGHGLGLSLVAAVADLHGVTVDLQDNAPGLRAVLTFLDPPPASR